MPRDEPPYEWVNQHFKAVYSARRALLAGGVRAGVDQLVILSDRQLAEVATWAAFEPPDGRPPMPGFLRTALETCSSERRCRVCGCTDAFAECEGGGLWVESHICSACAVDEGARTVEIPDDGKEDLDDPDDEDTTDFPSSEDMLAMLIAGRFRAAVSEWLDRPVEPDRLFLRMHSLIRTAHVDDQEGTFAVTLVLIQGLRATGDLDFALASLLEAAVTADREELARHLPPAILEAIPRRGDN